MIDPFIDDPAGATWRPIGDYGLLSDCQSAALISIAGSVDWLCFPRFDSPAVFGRLLDIDAGHWSIRPEAPFRSRRRYVEDSLVLETTFVTAQGTATLSDALIFDHSERGHDIGRTVPHAMARIVEVTEGLIDMIVEFRPRPEYGIVRPRMEYSERVLVSRGGADVLWLDGPSPDEIEEGTASWMLPLEIGNQVAFALHHSRRWSPEPEHWSDRKIRHRLADTVRAWQSWAELHQRYDGPAQAQVRHSGRILQGLTYQPTGAVVAAPTTSLPEEVGGSRNWDYRYSWIRDASFTLKALWIAACPEEAGRFLSWIIETVGTSLHQADKLQIMYGVGGEHDLSERELPHLSGWRDSRPVRVGNGAWDQTQTDIYGELLDAVLVYRSKLDAPSPTTCRFLTDVAERAVVAWQDPDAGIWEMRGKSRHHLYSKLMCWVAVDRAIQLADWLQATHRVPDWEASRSRIRHAIEQRGWNEQIGSFTQSFNSDQLDAAVLMLAITGFLPADDPRMSATIDAVATGLEAPNGLIYRYTNDDALAGSEGTFLLCSYWLVECLAARGDVDEAAELFDRANACANDLGLLSEETDTRTGELTGNFPQAFSHVGLVNAAAALSRSRGFPQDDAGLPS
ncbi:MAG: glycoside hydrolase family 15 protein [Acidimicrobiales bacterium]